MGLGGMLGTTALSNPARSNPEASSCLASCSYLLAAVLCMADIDSLVRVSREAVRIELELDRSGHVTGVRFHWAAPQ